MHFVSAETKKRLKKALNKIKATKITTIIAVVLAALIVVGIVLASCFTSDTYIYGAKDDGSGSIVITDYRGSGGDITIPDKIDGKPVTAIGEKAFCDCTSLISVVIPSSVITIGERAFSSCDSLKSVVIPNSVIKIGDYAFEDCSSLTSVVITNRVTTIGQYAFSWCTSLTSVVIPNSVTTIGNHAFYDCDSLTSIVIPNSVTTIGSRAFEECDALRIYCEADSKPAGWDSLWNYSSRPVVWNSSGVTEDGLIYRETENGITVFDYAGNASTLEIPSEINGKPVTEIEEKAFYNCDSLKSVVIPNSVTTIGSSAFYGCTSLTIYCEIEESEKPEGWNSSWNSSCPVVWGFTGTTGSTEDGFKWAEIKSGINIFEYTGNKATLEIPSEINGKPVTAIGEYAFYRCSSLKSVVIPNGVTTIGKHAFSFCTSLKSIVIPNSVTTIGEDAFYDCISLESIVIPNSVTTIGRSAFFDCDSLKSVVIPNSVTKIGNYAFYSCDSLTSIVIPNSVTTIGEEAFRGCDSLTIYCEADSKPEGWSTFWNLSNRPVVWNVSGFTEDGLIYRETENGITVSDYTGNKATLEIPSEINGKPVTEIGEKAFYDCSSLESVTIPNSVTTIEKYAFSYCDSLISVVIPNSVTTIGNSAFYSCDSLKSVVIPNSVTTIGSSAFYGCTSLTIYCEIEESEKPEGWSSNWNDSNRPVVWGHSHTFTNGSCVCGTKEN